MRPAPTTRMRSAPRCTAGEIGAAWRIEPSPQYSRWPSISSATAGKTNGIADDASRCAHRDRRAHGEPLRARPRQDVDLGVVERDVQARAVARRRDGQRVQMALRHHLAQPLGADQPTEQRLERLVVEQRARPGAPPARDHPADRHHRQPARAGADHAERIGAIDLLGAKVLPDVVDAGDGAVEVVGAAGERGSVDGAGRGAGDHRKGVAAAGVPRVLAHLRDRLQNTDLIGRPGTASGEDEAGEHAVVGHRPSS